MSEVLSDDSSESGDEEEPLYFGKRDSSGQPHGRGTQQWPKRGDRFEGHFCAGAKHGKGCFYFRDGSSLSGNFKDDSLEGVGLYTRDDGSQIISQYHDGELYGESTECSAAGNVIFKGQYKNDTRVGYCMAYDEYNAILAGNVDDSGAFSGHSIFYIYPDHIHALVGHFDDGVMVSAKAAKLDSKFTIDSKEPPPYHLLADYKGTYTYDPSSHDTIASQPLLSDPYEQAHVCVDESTIPGAGEGLFARTNLEEGQVISFYNGTRLSHKEVDNRSWELDGNTISLDDTCVLDVPKTFSDLADYTASLGHKANHSFHPNCQYDIFVHPRFGEIKCVRTLCEVNCGEELTCCYDYNHYKPDDNTADMPEWYLKDFKNSTKNSQ
ncbi:histone-lysine N-methyltransferase SETD7-like [Dysidea avara]|uniref:histone-lysine N-methyltransferase SETD7-like n=1 Tax=Dysidea avara TaxID=196820 RepID=UPI003327C65D